MPLMVATEVVMAAAGLLGRLRYGHVISDHGMSAAKAMPVAANLSLPVAVIIVADFVSGGRTVLPRKNRLQPIDLRGYRDSC